MRKIGLWLIGILFIGNIISCGANGKSPNPPAQSGQPNNSTKTGETIKFKKCSYIDKQGIGCEAFSMLIPADWKFEGGLLWRPHPAMPATGNWQVKSPNGIDELTGFPTLPFSWQPNTIGGAIFPIGSKYFGNEVQPTPTSVSDCVKKYIIPRFRPNIGNYKIISSKPVPQLTAVLQAESKLGEIQTVRIRIEYQQNGKPVEEDIYSGLVIYRFPQFTLWILDKNFSFKAEKGTLDAKYRIFETMVGSIKLNLQWFNKYSQLVEAIVKMKLQEIRNVGELSRIISQTNNEISEMRRSQYEAAQASSDRVSKTFSEYMRGTEEYYNPVEGKSVELPSGYNQVWTNNLGEYVLSNELNYNPNVGSNLHWQQIQKP